MRFQHGYAVNILRNVNMDYRKLHNLKTHDCHVLLQILLLIAILKFLPNMWDINWVIWVFQKTHYKTFAYYRFEEHGGGYSDHFVQDGQHISSNTFCCHLANDAPFFTMQTPQLYGLRIVRWRARLSYPQGLRWRSNSKYF